MRRSSTPDGEAFSGLPPIETIAAAIVFALLITVTIYAPALNGPFLFDDHALPYTPAAGSERPLLEWISGVRPVLMFTYWLNARLLGPGPVSYRVVNILLHVANSILVLLFIRRILRLRGIAAGRALITSAAAAALFLVHPVQTESVAYIAGRSETLTALFSLSALVLFVHQPGGAMSGRAAIMILALYVAAILSKEQAVILPALFLSTDVLLFGRSPRQAVCERRKLYVGLAVLAAAGLAFVASVLIGATTAGFRVQGLSSYEYFLTQSRVAFLYLQLILFPVSQNADYDIPVSRNLFDHGALLALTGIVAGLAVAWRLRRRYALAVYGIALCLICLAPTSTVIPIKDVAAERRLYLPIAGASLVVVEILLRQRPRAIAAVGLAVVIGAILTYHRAAVWGDDVAFWSDTTSKTLTKTRGYAHLMHSLLRSGKCEAALKKAASFPARAGDDSDFLVSLGSAYECTNRREEAVRVYERAAARSPGPGMYLILAKAYQRLGRWADSERAHLHALQLKPHTAFDRLALERDLRQTEQSRTRTIENH
ncbi:MAG TPA: tetratricopeptide repeat protein [Bryobacteraceae bacterium]|nr:tetratricopeptide repeat protein [Bryobacteraceae bacterium]